MTLALLLIAGLVLIDQITKTLIRHFMMPGKSIQIIPKVLDFTYVKNRGAAWSILQDQMVFFYIITIIAVGFFSYVLFKDGDFVNKKFYTLSLVFIIAGALGNFIDRLLFRYVVDFIHVHLPFMNFPIFNVADILLTIGTVGFAVAVLFFDKSTVM